LQKTYYDPLFDNILSTESYNLIKNTLAVRFDKKKGVDFEEKKGVDFEEKKRVGFEYLDFLIDSIMNAFLFNLDRSRVSSNQQQQREVPSTVFHRLGGNSKKNRRTKKKTPKTNKKNTRKAHPKKSNKRTKRKSRK
jgi:hypothetical protein